jgi:hypothetical protein
MLTRLTHVGNLTSGAYELINRLLCRMINSGCRAVDRLV